MSDKPGRNDPCPCGSGNKYKKCCVGREEAVRAARPATRYRFEAGYYSDEGVFIPSLVNLKLIGDDHWEYHFVLVKPASFFENGDSATQAAAHDMDTAFAAQQTGGDAAVAIALRDMGYIIMDDDIDILVD